MDYDKITSIKIKIDQLAKGIDPSSNIAFQSDTILNNNLNKDTLKSVSVILEELINQYKKDEIVQKAQAFYLSNNEAKKIKPCKEPINITTFVALINTSIMQPNMKKLRTIHVTKWLVNNGYLEEKDQNGVTVKVLTKMSTGIGMTTISQTNDDGETYEVNFYNAKAQKFILSHISEMTQENNSL